jgi:putative oxidoreductase
MKPELMWARFITRWVVGIIFFMAGWMKTFHMGPLEHARRLFIEQFAETWIPEWFLWAVGTAIPVVELVAGALVCLGFLVLPASVSLGAVLIIVTYGHLLLEPLYSTTAHIFPRLVLLVLVLVIPRDHDRLSLDHWLFYRRNRWFQPPRKPAQSAPADSAE